jgi:O-antigen/teichoic acid export membrane protein
VVDVTCLVVTASWLLGVDLLSEIGMTHLLVAIVVAQGIGLVVALRLLPPEERRLAPWRGGDVRAVFRFGGWRSAQQGVRPATLTLTRTVIVLATSTVVFGQLEAARVYTAPTMLVVSGVGAFLFASYAADKERPLRELLRRADTGAALLVVIVLALGAVATVLTPWAGDAVTGGSFELDELAVFGWVVFAAAGALLTPYGGLGAVSGLHVTVFVMRAIEAVVSVVAVVVVVSVAGASASWAPYALAVGSLVSGAIIRQVVLLPRAQAEAHQADGLAATATG